MRQALIAAHTAPRATPALLLAACLASAALPAAASNLFVNGSFETPTVGYQLVGGGNSAAIQGSVAA